MRSVRAVVRGRVQGVGYRWFTRDAADANAVTGWVRNRRDGTVEAELNGPDHAVSAVLDAMHAGPAHGRVESLTATDAPSDIVPRGGFEIRATA